MWYANISYKLVNIDNAIIGKFFSIYKLTYAALLLKY